MGVIDGHNYLLDINDQGSYHAKGGQYMVVCTEDMLKVYVSGCGFARHFINAIQLPYNVNSRPFT